VRAEVRFVGVDAAGKRVGCGKGEIGFAEVAQRRDVGSFGGDNLATWNWPELRLQDERQAAQGARGARGMVYLRVGSHAANAPSRQRVRLAMEWEATRASGGGSR